MTRKFTIADSLGSPPECGIPAAESDAVLLLRFVSSRDDLAFAKIVERHGNLVMGVCRRILSDQQDAEDAFQATFLVLARKASSLRKASTLPAWLHTTALRIALRARTDRYQRRETTFEAEAMSENHPALAQITADHERSVLDEELSRLPAKFRLPLFLCCVEGKSREEAADQLGWSIGSLKGRLERGRAMLRRRLSLRGVSLSVALVLWLQSQQTAGAAVAPSLVASTVQAGTQFAVGKPAVGYVSVHALHLANGSLSLMPTTLIKPILGSLLACFCLVGIGSIPVPASAGSDDGHVIEVDGALVESDSTRLVAAFDDDDDEEEVDEGERRESRNRRRVHDEESESDEEAEEREEREQRGRQILQRVQREIRVRERDSDEEEEEEQVQRERRIRFNRIADRDGDEERRRDDGDEDDDAGEDRRGDRDEDDDDEDSFRPATEREAALYRMILQLRREIAELRRARDGDRFRGGDPARDLATDRRRSADSDRRDPGELPRGWERSRSGKVFQAYDKNKDGVVTLSEWYAMKEGLRESDTERRKLEASRFQQADPNTDGKMTAREFIHWYEKGRFRSTRDGDAGSRGFEGFRRDGDRPSSSRREGEPRTIRRDVEREEVIRRSADPEL